MIHDFPADGESQTGAGWFLGQRVAYLSKFFKYEFLVLLCNADAVVGNIYLHRVAMHGNRHHHLPANGVAELDGVRQQIEHDLKQPVAVGHDQGQLGRHLDHEFHILHFE